MKYKINIILLICCFFLFSGFGCKCVTTGVQNAMKPVTLEYWRVWDDKDAFEEIINKYKVQHPYVNIKYKKLRYEEYQKELIEAFATDRGPDIFSVHNTWVREYQIKNLIAPMPSATTLAYPVTKGSIKKEIVVELKTKPSINLKQLKNDFLDVVYDDVVVKTLNEKTKKLEERIYALPLSVDTLVMFYNKDLFNNAGVATPPEYWNREFQQNIKKLTKQDNRGQIIQSGVALGTGANIDRASDIISVLMMQNGTEMMNNDYTSITVSQSPAEFQDKNLNPALDALRFYTDFSNPAKEVYSWNKTLDQSLEAFIQNKLAIMFGYAYMIPDIKARAPKLNFEIAKLPQIENNTPVNYANYWVEAVSNKIITNPANLKQGADYAKQKADTAWDFIQFITKEEQAKLYLDIAKKPSALRKIVKEKNDKQEDRELGIFYEQLLTSKSWYKGYDANTMEEIIKEMADSVANGKANLDDSIKLAETKLKQTIVKPE
jgi:multiple sugar transport system substrate-binding protein